MLKNVFKGFVKLRAKPGLYGKELAAINGSKFKAVNGKDRNWTEGKLKERLEKKTEKYLRETEEADLEEGAAEQEKSAEEIRSIVKELEERKERYQGYAEG
jgi:transposase